MSANALAGLRVVDVAGTVATSYCAKLCADYGADVINIEPPGGFPTRRLPPFLPGKDSMSALHAYLHTNKKSVIGRALEAASERDLIDTADLILDDGNSDSIGSVEPEASSAVDGGKHGKAAVRSSISWFGKGGPYENFTGSDGQCFALNGMLRGIGREEGPPLIPTGYQAQFVGGVTGFVGSMTQLLAGEIGNRTSPVHLETSILESCLCFTDVSVVSAFNTGIQVPRLGINRFPPTYPLGVFACQDGWIGVTILTPSQWHSFCALLDMNEFADVDLFQMAIGRLQSVDVIEPVMCERLLSQSVENLFYTAQQQRVPLTRVPTLDVLFGVDQFVQRRAFSPAQLPDGAELTVPSVPFRLFETPPNFGGPVAALGAHTGEFA